MLQGSLLPPRVGDEYLNEVLRSLGESGATYDRVVHRVFEGSSAGARAARRGAEAEAAGGGALRPRPQQAVVQEEKAAAAIRTVCARRASPRARGPAIGRHRPFGALTPPRPHPKPRRHGAAPDAGRSVSYTTAVSKAKAGDGAAGPASPRGSLVLPSDSHVLVLDSTGALLGLRGELRSALASWLAASGAASLRRYEIAPVFRAAPGATLPRECLQADFDIVGPCGARAGSADGGPADPTEASVADAEVIRVVLEVLEASCFVL